MIYNIKSGTAQHAFDRGAIWNPPIDRITGITLLDEIQLRETRPLEHVRFPKFVIVLDLLNRFASPLERLKHE